MKDAVTKATTDHKQFEQQLKLHRKTFGDSLGDLQERVLAFEVYDIIAKRAEHAREVWTAVLEGCHLRGVLVLIQSCT